MGARCTISLNELVHSCIMGTGPDNKRGRGRLAPIIHECTSSFSDIVHLAPIIHCCENTCHKDQKHNVLQFIATIKIFTSCKTKFIFYFHSNIFDNFVPLLTTLKNICKDTKNILKYIVCY